MRPLVFGSLFSGIGWRRCQKCGLEKTASMFHRKGDGHQAWCKSCHNAYQRQTRKRRESPAVRRRMNFKARYGLTETQIAELLVDQGGLCAICSTPPSMPVVDHDHVSGKVRGILCHRCNIRLSAIEDREYRDRALSYLARAEG